MKLMLWKDPVIQDHLTKFPIATIHVTIGQLFEELASEGEFHPIREQRIRQLHHALSTLIEAIDRSKIAPVFPSEGKEVPSSE